MHPQGIIREAFLGGGAPGAERTRGHRGLDLGVLNIRPSRIPANFRAGMLSLDFEEGSGLGLDHVVSGFGVVLVPAAVPSLPALGPWAPPAERGPR